MSKPLRLVPLFAFLSACASLPTGPSLLVLPGTGKSFDQFRADDYACRQFALAQVGGTPNQAAMGSGVTSAAVGTAVGAAAGAAIGGGQGAAVGAGTGLALGSAAGANTAQLSGYMAQQHYDLSYVQCMYASGHRVPVSGQFTADAIRSTAKPKLPPPPPPPRGEPPPPPPPAGGSPAPQ